MITYNDMLYFVKKWYNLHPDTGGNLEDLITYVGDGMKLEEGAEGIRKWNYLTAMLAIRFARMMDESQRKTLDAAEKLQEGR